MNIMPIFWRECKVNSTNSAKIVNHFINPVISLILFAFIFSIYVKQIEYGAHVVRFVDFFIPGLLALQVFMLFSMTFSMVRIDNVNGLLANIAISKTGLYSYFVGSLLANLATTILRIFLITIVAHFILKTPVPSNLINVVIILLAIFIGSVFWYSLGFVCGAFITREDTRDFVLTLLIPPFTFASSLYYNPAKISPVIEQIVLLNPLTYIINIIRSSFLLDKPIGWQGDILLLSMLAAFLLIISYFSIPKVIR